MKVDTKEFELPDTVFIRDIDSQVFQSIILQCLSQVKGVALVGGGLIESFLGLEGKDQIKGIVVEQDQQSHSINVKLEVNIAWGIPIPAKAEEIQSMISEEITKLTGLHVATVHVVFKNLYLPESKKHKPSVKDSVTEYTEDF